MSKARDLADVISTDGVLADGVISASELSGGIPEISQGDTVLSIEDSGSGGKVVIKVDNGVVGNINGNGIVIPTGTTAQRSASASLGELRYNTTLSKFEGYTVNGWTVIDNAPQITSVSPTSFDGTSGSSFTITGAFFESGSTVKLIGQDGTTYTTATTTFNSITSITFTTATDLPVSNEPYSIRVTNPAGLIGELSDAIDAGGVPAWQTASGTIITTSSWDGSGSATVTATDPDDGAISNYSIISGSLPSGFTFNTSTGAISGTGDTAVATTTYTFTVQATDAANNTSTRQFSIVITNAVPSWSGQTTSFSFVEGTSSSISLSATDPESQSVSYSVTSGSLPTGMTLSGSTISGSPSVAGSNSFSITATDAQGGTAAQAFSVTITQPPQLFSTVGNDTYAAVSGTTYEFIVIGGGGSGAQSGASGGGGGGAYFRGKYTFSSNDTINVTVGQGGRYEWNNTNLAATSSSSSISSTGWSVTCGAGATSSSTTGGAGGTISTSGSGITTVSSQAGGAGGNGRGSWGCGGGGAAGGGDGGEVNSNGGTGGAGGTYGKDYLGNRNGGAPGATTTRNDWQGTGGGGKAHLALAGGGGGGNGTVGSSRGAGGGVGGGSITVGSQSFSGGAGGTNGYNDGSYGDGSGGDGGLYGAGGGGGRSSFGPSGDGKKGCVLIWPSS